MNDIRKEYSYKVKKFEKLIQEQSNAVKTIVYFRLLTFIIGLSVTIYTFALKNYNTGIGIFTASLLIFIYLVIQSNKAVAKRKYSIALKTINENSLKRLNGEWRHFEDDGSEFKEREHNYCDDLDIFGKSSLFQWINTTKTYMGRHALKNRLKHPLNSANDIKSAQSAVRELAANLEFRQQLEAYGMITKNININPEKLYKWGKDRNELYTKSWLISVSRILPCITLILLILASLSSIIDYKLPALMILVNILILFIGSKDRTEVFASINEYKKNTMIYSKMISLICENNFESSYLKKLKSKLIEDKVTASIKKLAAICDRIADRQNMFFIIINIILLWDYQCMIEFEKWRVDNGHSLKKWLDVIGEFEALSSISNITHDNPEWAVPLINDEKYVLTAKQLGHPLICDNRVCNDVKINKDKNILLITGSNMSGKSTFLRTIGINLVLAYIGASVCAGKFECSIMNIMTCMRTSDNLDNNISSFYDEILRIKMIVQNVKKSDNVLFLLDELFKGTNSYDRHEGAKALIKQLGNQGASGLISTHDLELCNLDNEYDRIKNYHFKEYYVNNELKFDYKLREGASTTRNALYLIKLAGIDVKE